ncbi:MAG: peptidoglycan DD-metalloendopeptidase family protein [Pseudomonadota bacterium]|nr:peptidoglycan DD-metalloendopeptidase family protein [Pseudomonadota bacterium]MDE3038430.1 peptidoglycan DD-metalloendopeptidase family protein [Pseudomonadota bacterium]
MKKKACVLLAVSIVLQCYGSTDLFASSRDNLDQTQKALEQSRARQAALVERSKRLKAELADLQEQLVAVAKAVQKSEAEVSAEEENLHILGDQLAVKNKTLVAQRGNLAALVQAALRLSRTPPEAVIMMPGDALETMTAARALKMTAESIRSDIESIGLQLAELHRLKTKVMERREVLRRQQAALKTGQRNLAQQLAARRAVWDKVGRDQAAEAEKLAALARKAQDLQGLFSSLGHAGGKPEGVRGRLRPFADAFGHIRPPSAGHVVQLFGSERNRNETSRGIVIATRKDAPVTAPYDGEVVFTGPFRGYGQLVILRHSDNFHSLLAGLKTINVNAGQFLLEGEPIGAMGDSESSNRLYVELRKNNQPIDPAPWMGIR